MITKKVIDLLLKNHIHITTAESCTGGLIASSIVHFAGVSDIYSKGYVTYSNEAKTDLLGVSATLIDQYNVVSKETCREMAIGALKKSEADLALATTGVAGPDGDDPDHPLGRVFIGCAFRDKCYVRQYTFKGNRSLVRYQACMEAFHLIYDVLIKEGIQ